jgi:hypothetical protein
MKYAKLDRGKKNIFTLILVKKVVKKKKRN